MTNPQNALEPSVDESPVKRVIGGDALPHQIQTIDLAVAVLGQSRATFLVETAFERAKNLLIERGIPLPAAS